MNNNYKNVWDMMNLGYKVIQTPSVSGRYYAIIGKYCVFFNPDGTEVHFNTRRTFDEFIEYAESFPGLLWKLFDMEKNGIYGHAEHGTPKWAAQSMMLGCKVCHVSNKANFYEYTNGKIRYNKNMQVYEISNWLDMCNLSLLLNSGWEVFKEKERPYYICCDKCGGSGVIPNPNIDSWEF